MRFRLRSAFASFSLTLSQINVDMPPALSDSEDVAPRRRRLPPSKIQTIARGALAAASSKPSAPVASFRAVNTVAGNPAATVGAAPVPGGSSAAPSGDVPLRDLVRAALAAPTTPSVCAVAAASVRAPPPVVPDGPVRAPAPVSPPVPAREVAPVASLSRGHGHSSHGVSSKRKRRHRQEDEVDHGPRGLLPPIMRRSSCVRCLKAIGQKDKDGYSSLGLICSHTELYRRGERCARCSKAHHDCDQVCDPAGLWLGAADVPGPSSDACCRRRPSSAPG